ncbi:TPA: GNAT family N-acetyltransferase [Legionella pneumophila]|nr:N-acetyltransferase [Legionella pneumophila]HAT2073495.1 GNAT family N-acetyltransferase [Legionella pneumophila]HAU0283147.1 GNAT family N-acetyltransferase [Legionella pneumophila]HAU0306430.1 GNAT family N-acetyltransferase [Legionella pneumophila]
MNKETHVRIREIKAEDLEAIVALFKETVHHVNAKDYTSEQLLVWAPHHIHHSDNRWNSLLDNISYLVEIDDGIVGFADITIEGYLDRLFVHKDYQRQGIASQLVKKLESLLLLRGVKKITTEASITAKPFFESMGYLAVKEQNKPRPGGVTVTNFLMEKRLDSRPIKIDLLKNHPNAIPELAAIWHQVLGSIWVPDISVERVIARFQEHLNENKLPLTVVAFFDDKPVGMCSLRDNDGIRPDLAPWLGSLVVHPDYQREGIALKLINAIKQKAKQLDFSHLYLFAFDPTLPNYYAKLGWNKVGMDKFKEHDVTVMDIVL